MNTHRYRTFKFLHPDFDQSDAVGFGLTLGGTLAMVEEGESVRQSLLLLLSTVPGERIMRPDYGCSLHSLVFAVNDETTAGLAIYYVRRAVERWEPRVRILVLDAGREDSAANRLEIMLKYEVRSTRRAEELRFSVDLTGGEER
jgi:uncharacterized protein